MQQVTPKHMMTEQEAAAYLAVSRSFLRQRRCSTETSGKPGGPLFYKIGRRVLYRKEDLDRWINAHAKTCTRDVGF